MVTINKFLYRQTAVLLAGAAQEVSVVRPTTTPAFGGDNGNTVDYVTEPVEREDWTGGMVTVTISATLKHTNATKITKVSLVENATSPFTPTPTALIPSGASVAAGTTVVWELAAGEPASSAEMIALLKNISIRGDETLKITFLNAGARTGDFDSVYVQGMAPVDKTTDRVL